MRARIITSGATFGMRAVAYAAHARHAEKFKLKSAFKASAPDRITSTLANNRIAHVEYVEAAA
jgi:hypothetical protein